MKAFLLAAMTASALAVALPAAAQSPSRLIDLQRRIERSGDASLQTELRRLTSLNAQYRRDGLTRAEAQELERRMSDLDNRLPEYSPPLNRAGWQDDRIWSAYDGRFENDADRAGWKDRYGSEAANLEELKARIAAGR